MINILQECIVDTCLCALLFWAFGFAFMFGFGNGIIGHEFFFLNGAPATYTFHGTADTGVAFMAFWLFQFAFADTCSTITSGAMVGRTAFKGDLLYSIAVSGFVYPILGHWAWGPRRVPADRPRRRVVPRLRRLDGGAHDGRNDRPRRRDRARSAPRPEVQALHGGGMPPGHDLNIAALGGVILWRWYGFNPGSTLSAIDSLGIGRVATNTTLAAAAGGLAAMAYVYPRLKKWDIGITVNGFLGGLVGITAPCYWVNTTGAVIIGLVAGVIVVIGVDLVEHFRVDDPIGAVAVHGCCGIWGTWAVGLFATGQYGATATTEPSRACSGAAASSSCGRRSGATSPSVASPSS